MRANDIRRSFLEFFRERDHKIVPSASLVPEDPTLLFTVAGMVPFKPYFLGQRPIEFPRAASVQKCIRTNDIENVGVTARHQTLFEMLGNFSFGDYYKREAIRWAWELSIGPWGMDPDRIWITIFEDDDEAFALWREDVGLPAERVVRRGAEDNFWWMGVGGPAGPCSELHYDRGPAFGEGGLDNGDRLLEYYNLVFTEFEVDDHCAILGPLPRKNVDTGSGLERVAQILQDVPSAYETDVFAPIIATAQEVTGRAYGEDHRSDVSLRIMAEHARAAAFLIGDGVLPANEDRGYVLRRLIRRAVRHATLLGVDDVVMPALVDSVVAVMGEAYHELVQNQSFIVQVVGAEEEGFRNTIARGLQMLDTAVQSSTGRLSGDVAFKLHDTYGFPLELTLEIAQEAGLDIDREGFERLMGEQRDRARSARKIESRDEGALRAVLADTGASAFIGYDRTEDEGKILGIVRDGERVEVAREGDEIEVILDATPFYPEGGGQIGDAGVLEIDGSIVEISDTQRKLGDLIVHIGRVARGEISVGAGVRAAVEAQRRISTQRSHTATHVLHATLRQRLGEHARQAGSLVEPGRLRFDFPHFDRVPREVLDEIEQTVNSRLISDEIVRPYETTMEEARGRGAMMLFEEKYGDVVRVVEIGDYSVELCGGVHVTHTSQVGAIKILGEASIGSNLRRIEALTGVDAIADFRRQRAVLEHLARLLKATPDEAPARLERLLADLKAAEQQVRKAQQAGQADVAKGLARTAEKIDDVSLVAAAVPNLNAGELQKLALAVRDAVGGPVAVILASSSDGKAAVVAAVDKATGARVQPAQLISDAAKAIGGGAGGRGEVATGGGKNAAGVADAIRLARAAAQGLLR